MTRIILELDGDPDVVEAALTRVVDTGKVRLIVVRTKDNVDPSVSIVENWCAASKELNDWAASTTS